MKPLTCALAALACACTAPQTIPSSAPPSQEAWQPPPLERVISIRATKTGAELSFAALLDELAQADVVFLGETHTDETTHRVELGIYEGLLARRDVVLALEMFERDTQAKLDAYLAGEVDEAEFLAHARPWSNYKTAYRPMIEHARSARAPVVAANFPRPLRRALAQEGKSALSDLDPSTRQAPRELHANTEEYWRRVDNAVRGHKQMMRSDPDDPERLYSTQTLWDNSMGEACALALDDHPGSLVLHVNGGFHSAYWDGTVRQFMLRKPKANARTVSIVPVTSPASAGLGEVPVADYVVFAEQRATDIESGKYGIYVNRKLEYRLHVPAAASSAAPVPLLIWLGEDGLTAEDGIELWKGVLGDEAAILALDAPYRSTQPDLSDGGRWFFPGDFMSDVGLAAQAVERAWRFTLSYRPEIDPARVVLAGEGGGATLVATTALLTDTLSAQALAFGPRSYSKIKDLPLPLPEYRTSAPGQTKSLLVFGTPADGDWWAGECAEYSSIGFEAAFKSMPAGGRVLADANRLRAALGLDAGQASDTPAAYVRVNQDAARARLWGRRYAQAASRRRGEWVAFAPGALDDSTLPLEVRADHFSSEGKLPKCPGAFGGTTIVVVPDGADAEWERWLALEADDPIQKTSRFHRLRVARQGDAERSLEQVLAKLRDKGRNNVLIIPATFYADGDVMRSIARAVGDATDAMTVQYLPGLGGSL